MDLFVLDPTNFVRSDIVDKFETLIWTERYSTPGDVTLAVDATQNNANLLAEGKFLALKGTKEVMLIDTQSVEKGLLTVTGLSLTDFFKNRVYWDDTTGTLYTKVYSGMTPGAVMAAIVDETTITDHHNLIDMPQQIIPHLSLGATDTTITSTGDISFNYGPVDEALLQIASTFQLGLSMYLDDASYSNYHLKFKSYNGIDRTTGNVGGHEIVRFSPKLDSLADIKELYSKNTYKNVCFATYGGLYLGVAFAEGTPPPDLVGFQRRTLVVSVDVPATITAPGDIVNFLNAAARDALANATYTKMVDGTVVQLQHQFGVDYGMGDIVELEGLSGVRQKARITEYIRSQDNTGEKAYPTVSVIS